MPFVSFPKALFLVLLCVGVTFADSCNDFYGGSIKALTTIADFRNWAKALGESNEIKAIRKSIDNLPQRGSIERTQILSQIRNDMHPINGPGFTLVDLRPFLLVAEFEALFRLSAFPHQYSLMPETWMPKIGVVFIENVNFDSTNRKIVLPKSVIDTLKLLQRWMDEVLAEAIPEEAAHTQSNMYDVRVSTPAGGTASIYWHPDGNYITGTLAMVGQNGTWIRHKGSKEILKAPIGVWTIVSGKRRHDRYKTVKPTVHTSPDEAESSDRWIIISRSENGG